MNKRTWKLTKNQKAYIVVRLACYDSPPAIAKSLKEDFGIEITRQALERYNPVRAAGRACSEQWATLFYETRGKLIEGRADIGAAHKMVRLRWLDRMAHREMTDGNTVKARGLLKQVAEEMGESGKRKHEEVGANISELSDAEREARIDAVAARLGLVRRGGARMPGDSDGAAEEPQPPDEPLSG